MKQVRFGGFSNNDTIPSPAWLLPYFRSWHRPVVSQVVRIASQRPPTQRPAKGRNAEQQQDSLAPVHHAGPPYLASTRSDFLLCISCRCQMMMMRFHHSRRFAREQRLPWRYVWNVLNTNFGHLCCSSQSTAHPPSRPNKTSQSVGCQDQGSPLPRPLTCQSPPCQDRPATSADTEGQGRESPTFCSHQLYSLSLDFSLENSESRS